MASLSQGRRILKLIALKRPQTLSQLPLRCFTSSITQPPSSPTATTKRTGTGSAGDSASFDFIDGGNNQRSTDDHRNHQYRNPPEPIPNRPLRGQPPPSFNPPPPPNPLHGEASHTGSHPRSRRHRRSTDTRDTSTLFNYNNNNNTKSNKDSSKSNTSREEDDDFDPLSDDAFLDRFKLGLPNNNNNNNRRDSHSHAQNSQPIPPTSSAAASKQDVQQQQQNNVDFDGGAPPPPQDADEIFKKMKETGLIPNAVAMLDGLCKDGLVQEAMNLFALMRQKGTIPQVVVYTAVVDGFCKAHKLDDAKRIFRKMQNNGILPNAFSYAVLIQGLCKCNHFDCATDFCLEMLEAGHSPNVPTFVSLVDGLCREKGVEEAQSVISTLRQKGFHVNDKAVREFLDRKAPLSSSLWEVIFGKKPSRKPF